MTRRETEASRRILIVIMWGVTSHDRGMFMRPDSWRPWMHRTGEAESKQPESRFSRGAPVSFPPRGSPCLKPTPRETPSAPDTSADSLALVSSCRIPSSSRCRSLSPRRETYSASRECNLDNANRIDLSCPSLHFNPRGRY